MFCVSIKVQYCILYFCEVKIMSVQGVLDIIKAFFDAIIRVFNALFGKKDEGTNEEGTSNPQA